MNALTRSMLPIGAALALLLAPAVGGAQTVVTVGLVSPLSGGIGGPMALARELGFMKEEGIDVQFQDFAGSAVMLPQLAANRVTVGWPNPDPIILSHDVGKDPLPIKMFYNVFRASPWEYVVPEDSPITDLRQLKGKRLGIFGPTSGNVPVSRALMADLGINLDTDVELVSVGAGAGVAVAFNAKKIDALNHFSSQTMLTEESGVKLRRLAQPEKYARLFANGFATHQDTLKNQRELLIKFGRVFAKGVVACEANVTACTQAFWKIYPARKASIHPDDAKNLQFSNRLIAAQLRSNRAFASGTPHKLGYYDASTWKDFISVLNAGGQLKAKDIDPSKLYTNDLIDPINQFDAAAVAAAALAYKP